MRCSIIDYSIIIAGRALSPKLCLYRRIAPTQQFINQHLRIARCLARPIVRVCILAGPWPWPSADWTAAVRTNYELALSAWAERRNAVSLACPPPHRASRISRLHTPVHRPSACAARHASASKRMYVSDDASDANCAFICAPAHLSTSRTSQQHIIHSTDCPLRSCPM